MTIGIYLLGFTNIHKVYIGQSLNIEKRYSDHIKDMCSNTHTIKLQEAYSLYGKPELEILEVCDTTELNDLENCHIKLWDAVDDGFNTLYKAGDYPQLFGKDNPKCNYQNLDILEAVRLLSENKLLHIEIADTLKITKCVIDQIATGVTHTWVQDVLPNEYQKMILQIGTTNNAKSEKIGNIISASMRSTKYPDVISPEGELFSILNARAFAREHDLIQSGLMSLLSRKHKIHRGWVLA